MKNFSISVLSSLVLFSIVFTSATVFTGCGGHEVKKQGYAKLATAKDFEEDYQVVWTAVLAALEDYKIAEKDQDDGEVKTDWVYTTSNEKYIEYQVNGFPRKKYLQTRYKINAFLEKQLESVKVRVDLEQELEKLKSDGSSDGWKSESDVDSIRANEILKLIENKILSRR